MENENKKPNEEIESMPEPINEKSFMIYLFLIIGIIVIVVLIFLFKPKQTDPGLDVMSCISNKSQMFSQTSCSHCIAQKGILGKYENMFNITECDKEINKCAEMEITGTPTWIINGKKYEGVKSISELKNLTGC